MISKFNWSLLQSRNVAQWHWFRCHWVLDECSELVTPSDFVIGSGILLLLLFFLYEKKTRNQWHRNHCRDATLSPQSLPCVNTNTPTTFFHRYPSLIDITQRYGSYTAENDTNCKGAGRVENCAQSLSLPQSLAWAITESFGRTDNLYKIIFFTYLLVLVLLLCK